MSKLERIVHDDSNGLDYILVGEIYLPLIAVPEEIEEMKKREARKDRLHQNYLKRKANGKQQKRVVGLAESIER